MPTSESSTFSQTVSFVTFNQLRELMQKMAQRLGADTLILTEEILKTFRLPSLEQADFFTVLISPAFSALLLSHALPPDATSSSGRYANETARSVSHQVELKFDPGAIATFLQQLAIALASKPAFSQTLNQACLNLQPNDPNLQSEFTLRLIGALTPQQHPPLTVEEAYLQLCNQVQQQKDNLEREVIERTQNLHDAIQAAQSASRAKSEFLASVSHELRTPLTVIIGMSATMLRWSIGDLNQRQRSFLQTIHNSGQQLLELINDILDLSQVEAGKAVLKLSEFSLSLMAQQSLKAVQEAAEARGVELVMDLSVDSSLDRFVADPYRVRQILLNLLSNAVKFTPSGGKVTLRVFADKGSAIFQVKDTGIGIPEEQRSLLFQKFQQLDTSYDRMYNGTGLGLALTKQLVELHGGRITVDSTVNVGSVFTVQLPVRQNTALDADAAIRMEVGLDNPLGRILLIESNEDSANIICDMLTAAGYQLIWVLEENMAMNQIEILQPVAIIADIQSSHNNSFELIRRLRQNPLTKRVKVIALTASERQEDLEACLAAGADGCLTKPIQPEQILPKVLALTVAAAKS